MDQALVGVLIVAVAGLVGVVLTAAATAYHITKQARTTLKVDLYREILTAVEKQSEAEGDLSTTLRILNSLIAVWLEPDRFGGSPPAPNTSWAELNALYYQKSIRGCGPDDPHRKVADR